MTLLGVVAALPEEAACLGVRKPRPGACARLGPALIQVCGMGEEAARRAAGELVELGAEALVSWGTAGALDARLRSGDLLLPERIQTGGGTRFIADRAWRERLAAQLRARLPVHGGELVHAAGVVDSAAAKRALLGRTGAAATDMESAAVAAIAAEQCLPLLVVRSIADTADSAVPSAALSAVDGFGRVRPAPLLLGLCARPQEIRQLIALNRAFRSALATLRLVAGVAGPALGFEHAAPAAAPPQPGPACHT